MHAKRPRENTVCNGRPQFLLNTDELRKRTGKKYCDETELIPLLIEQGLIRRVRTISVEIHPVSGESFNVRLNAEAPIVGEAKEQIEQHEGITPKSQLLCRVQKSLDGSNVREFDQEPEELKDNRMELEEGNVIAMVVLPQPVRWTTFPVDTFAVSENGQLIRNIVPEIALITTGEVITEGQHYWEMEFVANINPIIGVCKPGLQLCELHYNSDNMWSMDSSNGSLWGNGKFREDVSGEFHQGDHIGVLLNHDDGSLLFFKNGVQHGPGYPAGSIKGGVLLGIQIYVTSVMATLNEDDEVMTDIIRLVPDAKWPIGHSPL